MKRLVILVCYVTLISCQDKVICPAFQSTYILDDSTRNAYFSYVWQLDENTRTQYLAQQPEGSAEDDSLSVITQPKTDYYAYAGEKVVPWRVPKRTKFGIVKHVPYPIKNYRLRTAPMENVLAPEPLSNTLVASDFSDSLAVDSLAVALDSTSVDSMSVAVEEPAKPKKKELKFLYGYDPADDFNVEQEYYNKYFAEKLIDRRPDPTPELSENATAADSVQTKEPFFKRLFKKKDKTKEELIESEDTDALEASPIETTAEEPEEDNGGG